MALHEGIVLAQREADAAEDGEDEDEIGDHPPIHLRLALLPDPCEPRVRTFLQLRRSPVQLVLVGVDLKKGKGERGKGTEAVEVLLACSVFSLILY